MVRQGPPFFRLLQPIPLLPGTAGFVLDEYTGYTNAVLADGDTPDASLRPCNSYLDSIELDVNNYRFLDLYQYHRPLMIIEARMHATKPVTANRDGLAPIAPNKIINPMKLQPPPAIEDIQKPCFLKGIQAMMQNPHKIGSTNLARIITLKIITSIIYSAFHKYLVFHIRGSIMKRQPRRKYSKEILQKHVSESTSWSGLIRSFGKKETGGNYVAFQNRVLEYGIDTSHFTGMGWNKGKTASTHASLRRMVDSLSIYTKDVLLSENSPSWVRGSRLKKLMMEEGIEYKCSEEACPVRDAWLGKPLSLHVDHRNGNRTDNRLENLRFLCPNCHQQTPTWGALNRGRIGGDGRTRTDRLDVLNV